MWDADDVDSTRSGTDGSVCRESKASDFEGVATLLKSFEGKAFFVAEFSGPRFDDFERLTVFNVYTSGVPSICKILLASWHWRGRYRTLPNNLRAHHI